MAARAEPIAGKLAVKRPAWKALEDHHKSIQIRVFRIRISANSLIANAYWEPLDFELPPVHNGSRGPGHGIGPALVAAMCHAYARSSFSMQHDLMGAFEHINQALRADLQTGRFVTFVAAVCRPDSSKLQILSAGHGPFFIYSCSEDRFIDMSAQAAPFGILPFFRSDPPAQLRLGPG